MLISDLCHSISEKLKSMENLASNLIEIQRMDPLRIAITWRIFRENIFYIFEKFNYQCKVNIIFIKFFYLNGKTKVYEIILALLENFFYTFKNFFQT